MKYRIIYSNRKTIALSIVKGELVVRAPLRTGTNVIETVIKKHMRWVENHISAQKKRMDLLSSLSEDDVKRLKKSAKLYFAEKTEYFSRIMGIKYGRITITSAEKRFGSCNSKGNICFSYRLMLYSEAAREYVIVHELAHILEMNHSDRFYRIIESVLPDYKQRKRLLK